MKRRNLNQKILAVIVLSTCYFLLSTSIASAGTIRKPPNNLGLILYWPMNEGDGTIVGDYSGNNRTGTFSPLEPPTWTNGKLGRGLYFNGSTNTQRNKITFPSISTTNTHTVSMWIKISANCGAYANLFASDGGNGLYCKNSGGNKVTYYYLSADHLNNTAISLNQWHHVAVINNAGAVTFYLDGVANGTASGALGYQATNIGNDQFAETFNGYLDDLRVYNRALSATEVLALYQSGTAKIGLSDLSPGTLKNGLTGHWTFDGKDMVSNVADVSGGGSNGFLTSFASTTTVPGKVGQALNFDGTNDNVVTNSSTSNFITATDGTISVWVRPTGTTVNVGTMDAIRNAPTAVSTSGLLELGIHRGNVTGLGEDKIWLYNNYTGSYVGVDYNVNEWAHITWVHTGGILYAYKNGELVDSIASGNTALSSNLLMGKNWCCNASTNHWRGDLDDIRTWNRALTESEIKQVYNIGAGQKVSTTKTPVGTLQTGLVAHWTFDGKDMIENVADVSGNGNNGTLTNFTSTTTVIGKIGQGLTFDGTNDYVNIPNTSGTLKPGTGHFSVSFWYKGGSGDFINDAGSIATGFWVIGTTKFYFSGAGLSGWATGTYTLPSDNEWHHFVLTLNRTPNPDTYTTYLDGDVFLHTFSGSSNGQNIPSSGAYIGLISSFGSATYRTGPMDDVRIYNRVLSASEVKQLYNLGK